MQFKKICALLIMAFLITGCATTGSAPVGDASSKMLDVSMRLRFEDVPVPSGFNPVANESFIFQNDTIRVGILKYSERAYADQVVNFYRDQMPLYNWRFINMLEYGRRIINFESDDQTCIVVVEPGRMNTAVTVTVAPKAGRSGLFKQNRSQ